MRGLFLAGAAIVLAFPVGADEAAGRYQLTAAPSGFVRLDTATGATAHCTVVAGVWQCEPLLAEGDLVARVDGLADELAQTKAALDEFSVRLNTLAARLDRVPGALAPTEPRAGFIRSAFDRLLAMVRVLKHGRASDA
jgi:hypothetical protein